MIWPKHQLSINSWPKDKKAGFCFSNDAEYLTLTGWDTVRSCFESVTNIKDSISTSFFITNPNPNDPAFSLLDSEGLEYPNTPLILELVKAGEIDGLHAIGNYDETEFNPEIIENGINLLSRSEHKINWWSNHGGTNNRQNIGAVDLENYQEGDLISSRSYSRDFTRKIGIKFFWLDDCLVTESEIDNGDIFSSRLGRDNESIETFKRYRGLNGEPAPTLHSLRKQLSDEFLENLLKKQASVVVYQHLGIACRNGREITKVVETQNDIPNEAIEVFEKIGQLARTGLWVSRTSEFLDFIHARNNLAMRIDSENVIHLINKSDMRINVSNITLTSNFLPVEIFLKQSNNTSPTKVHYFVERIKGQKFEIHFKNQ